MEKESGHRPRRRTFNEVLATIPHTWTSTTSGRTVPISEEDRISGAREIIMHEEDEERAAAEKLLAASARRSAMTGAEFVSWMEKMGLSYTGVQEVLGIGTRNTIARYRKNGAPLLVALACGAIAAGLGPYKPS